MGVSTVYAQMLNLYIDFNEFCYHMQKSQFFA
jgi:hypothetical protein